MISSDQYTAESVGIRFKKSIVSPIMILMRPEILFLVGVIQALFPYLVWITLGPNENYNQEVSGLPVILWVIGYMSFWAGTRIFSNASGARLGYAEINRHRARFVHFLAIVFWLILLILVINAYGGVPLLGYFSGSLSVDEVNESQASSIPGLFGMWLVINNILITTTTLAVFTRLRSSHIFSPLIVFSILVVIFGAIMAGKRQSLLIAVTIIVPSLILATNYYLGANKFTAISRKLTLSVVSVLFFLIFLFGFIGQVRTIGAIKSGPLLQIFNYLEFPLINMEWQLSVFGLFEGAHNVFPLISGLIPYKMISGSDFGIDNTIEIYTFFYPEPGIGAGFFGPVHLAYGISGVVIFGFFAGFFSKRMFNLAIKDPRWIIPYTILVWPLISAHSYSHLTSLLFFILPFTLSVLISRFVFKRANRRYTITAAANRL